MPVACSWRHAWPGNRLCRARLPGSPRRPRAAWLCLGEMGGRDRRRGPTLVVAATLPATVTLGLRHLESQRSLLALGKDSPGLSVLAKKLRLAPNHHVAVINAPPGYLAQLAPAPADLYTALKPSTLYDVVQLFVNNVDELRAHGATAIKAVKPDGLLW